MKYFYLILLSTLVFSVSCRKDKAIEKEITLYEGLDTNFYPGNFSNYTPPEFQENTNTERNLLIEEFTGHYCGVCPRAHEKSAELKSTYPNRVFVASIHAGPDWDGVTVLQTANETGSFSRDFTTDEGKELAATFNNIQPSFTGNPQGTVSRIINDDKFITGYSEWEARVISNLDTELEVNIQAESEYYPETNGLYLHVETEFLKDMTSQYRLVGYIIEKEIIDWQRDYLYSPASDLEFYQHKDIHIGNVTGETWGTLYSPDEQAKGVKSIDRYSYMVPDHLEPEDFHILFFVYDVYTYEVKQVIMHEIE